MADGDSVSVGVLLGMTLGMHPGTIIRTITITTILTTALVLLGEEADISVEVGARDSTMTTVRAWPHVRIHRGATGKRLVYAPLVATIVEEYLLLVEMWLLVEMAEMQRPHEKRVRDA